MNQGQNKLALFILAFAVFSHPAIAADEKNSAAAENGHTKAARLTEDGNRLNKILESEAALEKYNDALKEDPQFMQAYSGRAGAQENLGHIKEAISDLGEAIKRTKSQSTLFMLHQRRGRLRLAIHDYANASEDLTEYLKVTRTSSVLVARAQCYEKLNKSDLALNDLNEAVQRKPDSVAVRTARAQLLFRLKQFEKALADCDILVAADAKESVGGPRNFADVYLLRSKIYEALGKRELAAKDRKTAEQKEHWAFSNAPFGTK